MISEPLPARDAKSLTSHFDKRLIFLKEKDRENGNLGPVRPRIFARTSQTKSVNFTRRGSKRGRKVEK